MGSSGVGSVGGNAEAQALLALVRSSDSEWSSSLQGWDAHTPVCDWEGITCRLRTDGPAAVAEVSLEAKGLSGTIPTELGLLTELEHLILKKNMLKGSIPQELAKLKKLITLDLTQCFLTGTLPQRFESTELTSLLLANNAISGRFFWSHEDFPNTQPIHEMYSPHLQSIREIRMENNLLTGTLHAPTLMTMANLKVLSVSDNDLSGLIPGAALGSLPDLRFLYLDSNHFVGPLPSQLAQAGGAQLFELWVQDNALSGTVPASYARFNELHDFYIDGNRLTGAVPPELCGPQVNEDFFENAPVDADRNYCDSIACPAGSVALEGLYPCTVCPGGEAARLKNRYLGQQGECSDFSQREILKIFYDATTKAGPWSGVNDWTDESKPVCKMTGVTCDSHGNVVGISLENRNLHGHIPDEIEMLPFLETFDVSDNGLRGYVPSGLRWTSLTNLDVSGNEIRGTVPPLLCKMEELNGNGRDNIFHCDRIACPAGTFNVYGFRHGVDGTACEPCYDGSPFIGQKVCERRQQPKPTSWKEKVQIARETSHGMSTAAKIGLGVLISTFVGALAGFLFVKCTRPKPRGYELGRYHEEEDDNITQDSSFVDASGRDRYIDAKQNRHGSRVPRHADMFYSYKEEEEYERGGRTHSRADYRDFIDSQDDHSVDDGSVGSWSQRSATDFIKQHKGITMSRREKLKRKVSGGVPDEYKRRARDAASNINVGARRRWHAHSKLGETTF